MANKGEVYLRSDPLPGEASGGEHLAVVLSAPGYHAGGSAILAPLRRTRATAFRIEVRQHEFSPMPGHMSLDQDRVIDLGQVKSVPTRRLTHKAGLVRSSALQRVDQVLPQQFQFDGPWELRGCRWRLSADAPVERAVLIMNDDTLENERVAFFNAVAATDAGLGRELIIVHEAWLQEELEALTEPEQVALSTFLASSFGVAWTAS
ncbi:MAG: type II toxin-antitoxin system PemK/MazF family toxin [Chloroflexota bacterium]|nr:type II toxin-antitoxin system PemK/MazF family toxin [Chloroflexota bacterium]